MDFLSSMLIHWWASERGGLTRERVWTWDGLYEAFYGSSRFYANWNEIKLTLRSNQLTQYDSILFKNAFLLN